MRAVRSSLLRLPRSHAPPCSSRGPRLSAGASLSRRKKMNESDLEFAFWHYFGAAFAFTHFNTRLFGTFSQEALRSKAVAADGSRLYRRRFCKQILVGMMDLHSEGDGGKGRTWKWKLLTRSTHFCTAPNSKLPTFCMTSFANVDDFSDFAKHC